MQWRGAGAHQFAHGSYDVRAFQWAVHSRRLRCKPSLLIESAIEQSRIDRDARGNPALNKAQNNSRIRRLASGRHRGRAGAAGDREASGVAAARYHPVMEFSWMFWVGGILVVLTPLFNWLANKAEEVGSDMEEMADLAEDGIKYRQQQGR